MLKIKYYFKEVENVNIILIWNCGFKNAYDDAKIFLLKFSFKKNLLYERVFIY